METINDGLGNGRHSTWYTNNGVRHMNVGEMTVIHNTNEDEITIIDAEGEEVATVDSVENAILFASAPSLIKALHLSTRLGQVLYKAGLREVEIKKGVTVYLISIRHSLAAAVQLARGIPDTRKAIDRIADFL